MKGSFLKRISPNRLRSKQVEWPFPVEDGERPMLTVRVLGANELEAAYLEAIDHFRGRKPEMKFTDPAFIARERAGIVWRAYRDGDDPIADSVEELTHQPQEVLDELHASWFNFQKDVTTHPATATEMDALIDMLKKNTPADRLAVLPSSWLIGLITTLVSQLQPSTPANEAG